MMMNPEYLLREPLDSDLHLIHSSWIKGAYEVSPTNHIPRELYLTKQNAHINYCLKNFNTYVLCFPEEPDQLIGYVCYSFVGETLLIHWLYIRNHFRKRNNGSSLVPVILDDIYTGWESDKEIVLTQFSKHYKNQVKKYNLVYDPYYLEGKF